MPSRATNRTVRIAVLQAGTAHSKTGHPGSEANFALLQGLAREAATTRPDLVVFPEYAIAGWPYPTEAAINGLAEPVPGDGSWYRRYSALAQELRTPLLCALVERDGAKSYNTGFLLDRDGQFVGKYRKVHANLGEQTWWGWSQGESLAPLELDGVRYGVSICADMWYPETVRCEELLGANVVLHQSLADDMGHLVPARAFDSGLPIVAAIFNGGSYAVDAEGKLLGKLPAESPGWRAFELQPFRPQLGTKYGGRWDMRAGHRNVRNVSAYGVLTDPATRPPWTQVFLDGEGNPQSREQLLKRFAGRYDANDPEAYHQPLVSFAPPWTSPFTVDPEWRHHFVNREGHRLFPLNKTAWLYFGCKDPSITLRRAQALGANVIRVALEGMYYFEQVGIDLWPWGGTRAKPDWNRFDEAYWDRVEERVRVAGEHGVGLDVVLYCTLHPTEQDLDQQRPYWEQALRRLSKYANVLTWEIANEYTANGALQDAVGEFFRARDPYHRPVCTSAGTTDNAVWPQKPWVDLAINHSCTSSTPRHDLRDWYLAVARNTRSHGKPAWCNESGREKRHRNDDGVHRRKQGWLWCASGCFWTWHSWDGCEGIDDPDYVAPGREFVKPMADFFRSLRFWELTPTDTVLRFEDSSLVSSALSNGDGSVVVAYACAARTGAATPQSTATLTLPRGKYRVSLVRPGDLTVLRTAEIDSAGDANSVALPAFVDDLVAMAERVP